MSIGLKSLLLAATASLLASAASGQGLKQVGTIPIPGEPINQFGVMTVDQASGLGYLADKDSKSVVVFSVDQASGKLAFRSKKDNVCDLPFFVRTVALP